VPKKSGRLLLALAALLGAAMAFVHAARAAEPEVSAVVRVHERAVFTLTVGRAGQSAGERARAAGQALDTAVDQVEPPVARVEEGDGVAVVFVGNTQVVTLGPEDAAAAGDEALHAYATSIAARVSEGVRAEEKRSSIASTVFSVSLLIFAGLLAFLLSRRVGEFADRARNWIQENPRRFPALRLRHIEVVHPNAVRGGVKIAVGVAPIFAQLAIVYTWLLIALSLFDATRGYTERLTGFVVAPLWSLVSRVGSAFPVVVVAAVAALALGVLIRFVALFFESVAEGNTRIAWLPRDLAGPTSALARAALILLAVVLAAPLLTGTDDGVLSRVGVAVLVALGFASAPVVASVWAGLPTVFGQRLSKGDFVEIGSHAGRVTGMSLLCVTLEESDGSELRVPHLLSLVRPTRVVGSVAPLSFEITIAAHEEQARARNLLLTLAEPFTTRTRVDLVSLDGDGARYRVTGCRIEGAGDLASAIADGLRKERVALGRATPDRP
jgi:hypothetical protein